MLCQVLCYVVSTVAQRSSHSQCMFRLLRQSTACTSREHSMAGEAGNPADMEVPPRGLEYADDDGTIMEWDPKIKAYFAKVGSRAASTPCVTPPTPTCLHCHR